MSHFSQVLTLHGRRELDRNGSLFTGPGDLVLHDAERGRIEIARSFVGTIAVGRVASSGHDTEVSEPTGATLLVPVAGRITSAAQDSGRLAAVAGQALLFAPNRRQTRVEPGGAAGFLAIPVIIPQAELAEAAARLGLAPAVRRRLDAVALVLDGARGTATRDLIALARSLQDDLAGGDPRLLRAEAHRSWSARLTDQVIAALAELGAVALGPAPDHRSADRHVRRARDFMAAHFADIVTLSEVAEACGVSVRTLEAAFREVWCQTPHQALVELRLQAARRALVAAGDGASVTEIALACGFGHLGRFSVGYRARFAESPSEALRRLRR